MSHPTSESLKEFLKGQLAVSEEAGVETHLSRCSECQTKIDQLISQKVGPQPTDKGDDSLPQFGLGSRFLIQSELARGGMGVVYRGFDRELKRQVAIKVCDSTGGNADAMRFHREAQISGQLQHPGIVPVYEQGRLKDDRSYLAMKLVEGQTLLELIRNNLDNVNQHLDVFGSICQTMAYAHSRNFIHRDLKPENVMVGRFGETLVMDWGLAKKLPSTPSGLELANKKNKLSPPELSNETKPARIEMTVAGAVFGTPAYMAPEQAQGKATGKQADVFAIGGTLYQILTGKAPFSESTTSASLSKASRGDLKSAWIQLDQSGADTTLVSLAKSCLSPNPLDRPADAEIVNEQYCAYVAARDARLQAAKLEQARVEERLIAQKKRVRQIAILGAIVIAALVTTAFAGVLYLSEKSRRQAELAKTALAQFQRETESEKRIQKNLVAASTFRELAKQSLADEAQKHWQAALFEVRGAKDISETIPESLQNELNSISSTITREANTFFAQHLQHQQEFTCREKVRRTCYESLYPGELRVALLDRLTDQFAEAYAGINVKPGDLSDEIVARISESEYHAFLMHGLLFWRVEIGRESRRYGVRKNDASRRQWLDNLLIRCEKDPFRKELRNAAGNRKHDQLTSLMKQDQATASFATVLLCTPLVEFLKNSDDRIDYLMRAQQAFPDEFQVKWKLSAVNGLDSKTKQELGFRSALACHALEPTNPAVMMNLGATYIEQKNYPQAIDLLEQVVEIAPRFVGARCNLANAYSKNGQHDLAIRSCEEILGQSKDLIWALKLKGEIHKELGQLDTAADEFKRILQQDKDHPSANHYLYQIYRKQKKNDLALEHLAIASIHFKDAGSQREYAAFYVSVGELESAEASFKRVLKIDPKDYRAPASLANIYLRFKKPELAESVLRKVISQGVAHHRIQLELAKALLAQSNGNSEPAKRQEGIRILKKLVELAPQMKEPSKILKRVAGS